MYVAHEEPQALLTPGYYTFKCEAVFSSWWAKDKNKCWRLKLGIMTLDVAVFLPAVLLFGARRVAHGWGTLMNALIADPLNPFGVQNKTREAAGITDGLVATDRGVSADKIAREECFPMDLLVIGATFICENGEASVQADKFRILAEIDSKAKLLNDTVHGVVADGSALRRALERGGSHLDQFLAAVQKGGLEEVEVNLVNSKADTLENVEVILKLIDPKYCTKLILSTRAIKEFPEGLVTNLYRLTSLSLNNCSNLKKLPPEIRKLRLLTELNLTGCLQLAELPEEVSDLHELQHLPRKGCYSLNTLPNLSNLNKQRKLNMHFDPNDEFVLRVYLCSMFPALFILEVWLIGGLTGCGWQLSAGVMEYFCWTVLVHEVVVFMLLQDVRSVCSQVCWAANGYRNFPWHWRNMLVIGYRVILQVGMFICAIYFHHENVNSSAHEVCDGQFSPSSVIWSIIGFTLFQVFVLPNVIVRQVFTIDIMLILKHTAWLVPFYSIIAFPIAFTMG